MEDRDHADWARAVKRGYDEVAETYDEQRDPAAERRLVESLAADLAPGARVLDAGCGAGRAVLEALESDVTAVGLDVSAVQLWLARARVDTTPLVQGDVTRLPFASDTFDAVTSLYTVIHVPREHHPTVFAELARVCRPGGAFLVGLGANAWEGENDDWLDSDATMRWSFHGSGRNRELLQAAGFCIDEETTVGNDQGDGEWLFLRGWLEPSGGT